MEGRMEGTAEERMEGRTEGRMEGRRKKVVHLLSTCLVVVLLLLASLSPCRAAGRTGSKAPTITRHPPKETSYKPGEDMQLTCQADSDSNPTYSWMFEPIKEKPRREKRHEMLDLSGRHVALIQQGSGDLIIRQPSEADDGEYQCFATNEFGTAASTRTLVKRAFIDPFPTVNEPTFRYPIVGDSLSIPCSRPFSYPKGVSYWGINRPKSNKLESLPNDDRVLLDYDGHLHFANVKMSDSQGGIRIVCIVHNVKLGAYVQGMDNIIQPRDEPGAATKREPRLLWSSPVRDVAVKGDNKTMKCIFAGLPTPKVTWRRTDGLPLPASRVKYPPESFGTEIEIQNIEETDNGKYECVGTNTASSAPAAQEIQLIVHSRPFWNQGRPPADIQTEEENDVEFDCVAHGFPKPNITWGINGKALHKLDPDPRRTVDGTKLRYRSVTKSDSQVLQCIAANEHGSILANVNLLVIAELPSFTHTPNDAKVSQGTTVKFECRSYGAPKPTIQWTRSSPASALPGNRFTVLPNGDLEIRNVMVDDSAEYHCEAKNKLGTDKASAVLRVRSPTVITQQPQDAMMNRGENGTLQCGVKTDSAESANLKVEWRKDGVAIDYRAQRHLSMDPQTYTLTFRDSKVDDSAKYICHADNGVDKAESQPATITVRDRPSPPRNVQVKTCLATNAEVSFTPGNDNNDPITTFTIYYSLPGSGSDERHEGPTVRSNRRALDMVATVAVLPWRTYVFYVTARNSLGVSDPSAASPNVCNTPQAVPKKNPSNVCSRSKGASTQLVITWDAVPKDEQYGEGFYYLVSYRELSSPRDQFQKETIRNPNQTELVIHGQPVYTKYEIFVQSGNKLGTLSDSEHRIGFSGEGKPKDAPTNFRLHDNQLNGTHATFIWDPVSSNPATVRGFFRGYRLKFWKTNDPNNKRTEDIIVNDEKFNPCPLLSGGSIISRKRRATGGVIGSTGKLWSVSSITAVVSVLNFWHDGTDSNQIKFETPVGLPGPVKTLEVKEQGSSHLIVAWTLPAESNGVIKSYILEYQVAPPAVGLLLRTPISNPARLSTKILGLEASTKYRVTLYAETDAGQGEAVSTDGMTLDASNPDKPYFGKIEAGLDSANVSIVPSEKKPPYNPGSRFHVEYVKNNKEGADKWNKTTLDPHNPDHWINIPNLEPGTYLFRVVAENGVDDHIRVTYSDPLIIEIGRIQDYEGPKPTAQPIIASTASAGWFIILMCIIAFLLIILLIVCCVKHSQGEMYPVYETEKMLGRDPYATDEAPFGEYNNSGRPDPSRSQGSLDSEDKPLESDTDSLGEYEDPDASKFNEDGSFIGLYGGKNKPMSDASSPHAVNTFV